MTREQHLKDVGWTEPLDESPFDLPDGVEGGGVINTGGGIYCRIWRNETDRWEVIYNLSDETVSAEFLEDTNHGLMTHGVTLLTRDADAATDEALAEAAQALIERLSH